MDSVLERLPERARVAVVRLRSLGDCVLTTPALALLKCARPDLEIGVVVEDRFAPVFSGNPDVSRTIPPSWSALARWRPQLCLNLHGGPRSAQLTLASRARLRAGFEHFRFRPIYNLHIPAPQPILGIERKAHTVEHIASAVFWLAGTGRSRPQCEASKVGGPLRCAGVYSEDVSLREIPAARLFANADVPSEAIVVIHPFASAPDKTWPAERFIALANHSGLEPVFIGAATDDMTAFRAFRCLQGAGLEKVKNLLAIATLFIGNDSGPAHMASAFGLPALVFFGNSDLDLWRPWKSDAVVLSDPAGIHAIPLARAVEALERLGVKA